jgi:hypothetical protein
MNLDLVAGDRDRPAVLRLRGAFGDREERQLHQALDDLCLLIDLGGIAAVPTDSLMRLIRFGKQLEQRGGAYAFSGLPQDFERALHQEMIDFPSFETADQAWRWLASHRRSQRTAQAAVQLLAAKGKGGKQAPAPPLDPGETRRLELALRLLGTTRTGGD